MTTMPVGLSSGSSAMPLAKSGDFSLVNGGLLNRFWRCTGMAGDALQLVPRRAIIAAVLAWVPLLLLSLAEGHAWGDSSKLTFLLDIETHLRLLIAVPLLILAEVKVHQRLHLVVRAFVANDLVPDRERPRFDAAIAAAMRLRNSAVAELLLIAFVYSAGLYIWRNQVAIDVSSWQVVAGDAPAHFTNAGWWAALVSMPLFQFLMLRWFFRFFIWARFLWQVSRLDLSLEPMHPDGTAGLRFLSLAGRVYSLFLLAMGTVLSGMIANRIFYADAKLIEFKLEIVGWVAVLAFFILGPLLVFVPKLRAARREGIMEYDRLGQRYAREFHTKWVRDGNPPGVQLLGSADIQSLADIRNAFVVVEEMRRAPVSMKNVTSLAAYVLAPVAPLLLTTFSVEQLVDRMLKTLM